MRLNTKDRHSYMRYVYLFMLILVIFDMLLIRIPGTIGVELPYLTIFVGAILLLIIYRGNAVFRYDSDGEVLILDSRDPVWGHFLNLNKLYEFPKRKFMGYRIKRLPFRRTLILKVRSKEAKYKTLRVNISYLKPSEVRHLSRSLDSVAKANKNISHDAHDDD
ncbi:MAG: hypothetical protein HWD92_07930 [Flavobacteriia bacterium]|nr:hypothetical protein [Flavobacteriia bacterium]